MIGLIPGLVIVFFILNKKGASCSGYLPNSRVIAETLSKDFTYSESFKNEMAALKIDEKFIKKKNNALHYPCRNDLISLFVFL